MRAPELLMWGPHVALCPIRVVITNQSLDQLCLRLREKETLLTNLTLACIGIKDQRRRESMLKREREGETEREREEEGGRRRKMEVRVRGREKQRVSRRDGREGGSLGREGGMMGGGT